MEFLNLLGAAFSPWGGGEGGDTPVNFDRSVPRKVLTLTLFKNEANENCYPI